MARYVVGILITGAALAVTGCTPPPAADSNGLVRCELTSDGRTRSYWVHAPNGQGAQPVVLAFHGSGGTGPEMCSLTGLNDTADQFGFIAVYPDGVGGNWNDGRPNINPGIDDVGFVRALLDDLSQRYAIDPQRVFAAGLSNGGHLCFRLAFALSDRIAAIAPVAALLSEALRDGPPPPRPTPVLVIAGDADPISPYGGGVVGGAVLNRGVVLSARDTISYWVEVNHASATPEIVDLDDADPADGTRAQRESHAPLVDGAETILLTIEGGGHTWPGGAQYLPEAAVGRTSRDLSANMTQLAFFLRNPRR